VQPVYPITNEPPDPLASKLCEALHGVPQNRKATCCGYSPGFSMVPECTRTLSYALGEKAVTIDPAAVDQCVAALEKAHEGCAWVGPSGVSLPEVCDGLVKGTLDEGKKCRSSLECVDGLRCVGVGPTDAGVCRKPSPSGYPCGIAVDTLAALARQDSFEAKHPECTAYCAQRRCQDPVPVGKACTSSLECGLGQGCFEGKCAERGVAREGEACAKATCAKDLRCIQGKCAQPKDEGAACTLDIECRGGCLKGDAGKGGTCGMKCRML